MTVPGDTDYQRLRIEWQRFKSHVIDPYTGLPTLAAVLDDVRRLMEERGTLGLVYLDLSGYGRAEARYGSETYDALVQAFALALTSLRGDGRLGPRGCRGPHANLRPRGRPCLGRPVVSGLLVEIVVAGHVARQL